MSSKWQVGVFHHPSPKEHQFWQSSMDERTFVEACESMEKFQTSVEKQQ